MRVFTGVLALFCIACGDTSTPQPTPLPPVSPSYVFSLSGYVGDTASRPLGGASVDVIDGQTGRISTKTDEAGRFALPGTFTGMITVTASKDGHWPQTRTVPGRMPFPPSGEAVRTEIGFSLEPLAQSVNIAAEYTLTLVADPTCASFPAEARSRTYGATIVRQGSTLFTLQLDGGAFFASYRAIEIRTAADFLRLNVWGTPDPDPADDPGPGIVERLHGSTYVAIGGEAATSIGESGLAASFSGFFEYCPSPAQLTESFYRCSSPDRVTCDSRNHQMTLVKR